MPLFHFLILLPIRREKTRRISTWPQFLMNFSATIKKIVLFKMNMTNDQSLVSSWSMSIAWRTCGGNPWRWNKLFFVRSKLSTWARIIGLEFSRGLDIIFKLALAQHDDDDSMILMYIHFIQVVAICNLECCPVYVTAAASMRSSIWNPHPHLPYFLNQLVHRL